MRKTNTTKKPSRISIQPTREDWAIIRAGMEKRGAIEAGQIIREALRKWADLEGLMGGNLPTYREPKAS